MTFLLLIISVSGFIVLIVITYAHGESQIMYESYYSLFGVFVAIPFCHDFLKNRFRITTIVLLIFLLFKSLSGIYGSHFFYKERLAYFNRLITHCQNNSHKKALVEGNAVPWPIVWVPWAIAFESLMLSSIEGRDKSVTLYAIDDPDFIKKEVDGKEGLFLGPHFNHFMYDIKELDKKYFILDDSKYIHLNTYGNDSIARALRPNDVELQVDESPREFKKGIMASLPVLIKNKISSTIPSLYSGKAQVHLSYHLFDNNNKMVLWEGRRSILEVDIKNQYSQGLLLDLPLKRGEYFLDIDMVTENDKWWGKNKRIKIRLY